MLNRMNGGNKFWKKPVMLIQFFLIIFSCPEQNPILINNFLDAATDGDIETVKQLLLDGIPLDVSEETGQTALMFATQFNQKSIVSYLLQEGADVNKKDAYGNTALHRAARTTDTEIIRMLVDKGADMELKNRLNETEMS